MINGVKRKEHKHFHLISVLVEDHPGVLTRISGLFSRRSFNIDTITVGKTNKRGISKIVLSVLGDDTIIEQVEKQINKLIDSIKVQEVIKDDGIVRELCLVKVSITNEKAKKEVLNYANIYKCKIVDVTPKSVIIQIVGMPSKIDGLLELVESYGIKDISRTGITAISRGSESFNND